MDINRITENGKAVICDTEYTYLNLHLFSVMKCNFNDERLIDFKSISLCNIKDQPFIWIDPFFGRGRENVKIALAYVSGDEFVILKKTEDEISILKAATSSTHYVTEKSDATSFLATHVELSKRKIDL